MSEPMLVDSHCHLDFPELIKDIDGVIARAVANGVGHMVSISTRISSFDAIKKIAEAHDEVSCTVGVHPQQAAEEGDISAKDLAALTEHHKVIGIGETGLDYFYDTSPRDLQKASFERHLEACRLTGLPVIIHSREAEIDTLDILKANGAGEDYSGVMHCFSSKPILAEEGLKFGFYISFSGIVTFKNSDEIREVAAATPLDRILVETDSPFLAPVPHRGKSNEPSYVRNVAEIVAAAKGVTYRELAEATTENFYRLFPKANAKIGSGT